MNNLKHLAKTTEHRFMDNPFEYIQTTYEFSYVKYPYNSRSKGAWFKVTHRIAIGKEQATWRAFKAQGMAFWEEGKSKDKHKLKIEQDCKEWFAQNNLPWDEIK